MSYFQEDQFDSDDEDNFYFEEDQFNHKDENKVYFGVDQFNHDDVIIVVMGPSGAGKTTFINHATDSELGVGHGIEACTTEVQTSDPKIVGNKTVYLLDTRGYDDAEENDTEVLRTNTIALRALHEAGLKISGVIYVHSLSGRWGAVAARTFDMFKELVGEEAMGNVLILTTMWDKESEACLKESQLKEPKCFGVVLSQGARMVRYSNDSGSAERILTLLVEKNPVVLRIQKELEKNGATLAATGAGQVFGREAQRAVAEFKQSGAHHKAIEQAVNDYKSSLEYSKDKQEAIDEAMRSYEQEQRNVYRRSAGYSSTIGYNSTAGYSSTTGYGLTTVYNSTARSSPTTGYGSTTKYSSTTRNSSTTEYISNFKVAPTNSVAIRDTRGSLMRRIAHSKLWKRSKGFFSPVKTVLQIASAVVTGATIGVPMLLGV